MDRGGRALPDDPRLLSRIDQRDQARLSHHDRVLHSQRPAEIRQDPGGLAEFITFGFYGTLTWIGIELTQKTRQKMISLPIPKAWIYAVCVVALALMTVYSAIWLWRKWRAPADEIADMLENGIRAD